MARLVHGDNLRLIVNGLPIRQARLDVLFANVHVTRRTRIAVAGTLANIDLEVLDATRHVHRCVVPNRVRLKTCWSTKRYMRRAGQTDWCSTGNHAVLRRRDARDIWRSHAARSEW